MRAWKAKSSVWVVVVLLAGLAASSAWAERKRPSGSEEVGTEIPPVLNSSLFTRSPAFVSADVAINPDGSLNTAILDDLSVTVLGNLLREFEKGVMDRTDCVPYGPVWVDRVNPPDRSSLKAAAQTSEFILEARVVAKDAGFYRGSIPGQLLKVVTEQVVRGEHRLGWHYVFYPVGEVKAGPYTFCKTDHRYPDPPKVGDRVLLLVYKVFDDADPLLDLRDEHSIIVLDSKGGAHLSENFAESTAPRITRDEVISEIKAAVEAQ